MAVSAGHSGLGVTSCSVDTSLQLGVCFQDKNAIAVDLRALQVEGENETPH